MHIRLDGVRTDVRGAPEGSHRVLGVLRLVAAVRNRLRETPVRMTLRSEGAGPGRWRFHCYTTDRDTGDSLADVVLLTFWHGTDHDGYRVVV
jgi:hypothetical protein